MIRSCLLLIASILLVFPAIAQDLITPDPGLTPDHVVEIQLSSLQQNDMSVPDGGIAQTWAFAHPNNKAAIGPLERFASMIKGPSYRMLIDHQEHTIQSVVQSDDYAMFVVSVISSTGQKYSYRWELSKVQSGILSGSWMTTNVSAPLLNVDGT